MCSCWLTWEDNMRAEVRDKTSFWNLVGPRGQVSRSWAAVGRGSEPEQQGAEL